MDEPTIGVDDLDRYFFDTQSGLKDLENAQSKARQKRSREEGRFRRELRKKERAALARATSTEERRKIKEYAERVAKEAEFDLSTEYEPSKNKQDAESDIEQRGIDTDRSTDSTSNEDLDSFAFNESSEANELLDGFAEESFDVVQSDNTAGTRTFLTKS